MYTFHILQSKLILLHIVMSCGKLSIITGPMWSGKTSELLRRYERAKLQQTPCILVKPSIDNRYEKGYVVSHRPGLQCAALVYPTISDLIIEESLYASDIRKIFIDEIQFFPDKEQCLELLKSGIDVCVAGLNSNFMREMFAGMPTLFASAHSIDMLCAVCGVCNGDATQTARTVQGGQGDIDVGGEEKYIATCIKCHGLRNVL